MSSWSWCKRAVSFTAALLLIAVSTGCEREDTSQSGSTELRVILPQGLASVDVKGVRVEVRGPGLSQPLSAELLQVGSVWEGMLGGIPAGTERVFEAFAYDAASTVLYQGRSAPISIGEGATVSVALTLQQVGAPPPYQNVAPVIDSLVVSASTVRPGGSITLTASASDANGDALSYAWTASAGTFDAPGSATTSWQAPATVGVQRLRLQVTDAKGTSTSMSFEVSVQQGGSTGSASVSVGFNSWPEVSAMQATPTRLSVGGTTLLSVAASDADGDVLRYDWSTDCTGTFNGVTRSSPAFALVSAPASGLCTFKVLLSDGRGGQQTGSLGLLVGTAPRVNVPPHITGTWQSATLADGGQTVTLGLTAQDFEGTPVAFTWSASSGSISSTRWVSDSSEADWLAPSCFDDPARVTATVTDADGATTQHVFSISPSDAAKCGTLAVTGVRHTRYVQADGSVLVIPYDLSTSTLGAWVPDVNGTSYVYQAGAGQADGTFLVPNVERTPYLLQFGTTYLWLESRQVDLSSAKLGRPDAVGEPVGTRFDYELSGLFPYQPNDELQLHSTGAGIGYFFFGCASEFSPTVGSQLLTGSFDYALALQSCGSLPARLEPAKGDDLIATQLVSRVDTNTGVLSPVDIQELRASARVPGLEVLEGGAALLLRATMQPLPTQLQPLDFRASEYESLASASHPNTVLNGDSVFIDTLPRYLDFGSYDGSPDLAIARHWQPGEGDLLLSLDYGNPYPQHWGQFVVAQGTSYVRYTYTATNGSSRSTAILTSVTSRSPLTVGVPQLLVPRVGPPRELTLDGQPATVELQGLGPTPLVGWTVPTVGTPDRYVVRVYELFPDGMSGASRVIRGTFYTQRTQLRVPPGLLTPGKRYAFQVYAYVMPGTSMSTPFTSTPEQHYASAITSQFIP